MGMKLLAFNNQLVSDFASNDQNHNLVSFDIIQGTQVACAYFELSKWIGAQALDRLGSSCRVVLESGLDSCLQDSLVTGRQRSVVVFRHRP
jgi:hypothetical protein